MNKEQGIEVFYKEENVWAAQKAMATLFDCDRSVITKHLGNIFASGELQEDAVCAKFAHIASDGKSYQTQFYSLDAIIAVGYRVNRLPLNPSYRRTMTLPLAWWVASISTSAICTCSGALAA